MLHLLIDIQKEIQNLHIDNDRDNDSFTFERISRSHDYEELEDKLKNNVSYKKEFLSKLLRIGGASVRDNVSNVLKR